jgi:hypothetical protein
MGPRLIGSWLFEVLLDGLDSLPDNGVALLVQSDGFTIQSRSKKEEGGIDVFFAGTVTDVTFRVLVDYSGLRVLLLGHVGLLFELLFEGA